MNSTFRVTQDRNTLYVEGVCGSAYPGYDFKVESITLNSDNTLDIVINIFDASEDDGMFGACVTGEVEIEFELNLDDLAGYNGQELRAVHFKTPGSFDEDCDVDIDQA